MIERGEPKEVPDGQLTQTLTFQFDIGASEMKDNFRLCCRNPSGEREATGSSIREVLEKIFPLGPSTSSAPRVPDLIFRLEAPPRPTFFFRAAIHTKMIGIYHITNFDENEMVAETWHDGCIGLRSCRNRLDLQLVKVYEFPSSGGQWVKALFELGKIYKPGQKYMFVADPAHKSAYTAAQAAYREVA